MKVREGSVKLNMKAFKKQVKRAGPVKAREGFREGWREGNYYTTDLVAKFWTGMVLVFSNSRLSHVDV